MTDLKPLTPAALARTLSVHASTIIRLLEGRSLIAPWNEQIPLRLLAPNRKKVAVAAIQELLEKAGARKWTDEDMRRRLRDRYGIILSRRSVNECRREA